MIVDIMTLLSVVLYFLLNNFGSSQAFRQDKAFIKVCENAQINLKPMNQIANIGEATDCALVCAQNIACEFFNYNSELGGRCNLFKKIKKMKLILVEMWAIFAIKSKKTPDYFTRGVTLGLTKHTNAHKTHECLNSLGGVDYKGKKSITKLGYTCQYWNSNTPHKKQDEASDPMVCTE